MKPLVSVVVPVYNAEPYLSDCMNSLIDQSYENIEIICVDDGSKDHSRDFIHTYRKKDKRIKLIEQNHSYAGVARNKGIKLARGKYVMFLDADDLFDSRLIEKMVEKAENTNADIVICKSQGYDVKRRKMHDLEGSLNMEIVPQKDIFSWRDVPELIFQLTSGWPWDKIYRLDFIREKNIYFQDTRIANDELFVDIAFAEAEYISIIEESLVTHRTNVPGSIENTRYQWWKCGFEMLYAERNALKERNLFLCLEKSFVNRAAKYITWNICEMNHTSYFHEFYNYAKSEGIRTLGLQEYSENFYEEKYIYNVIQKIVTLTEAEYLVKQISELKGQLEKLSGYIQNKRWYFPEDNFEEGTRLVIYGYGEVGRDFCQQIINSRKINLIAVADQNYETIKNKTIKIQSVEEILNIKFDFIVIAILNKNTAQMIKKMLISRGISPKKIVWYDLN